MIPTNSDVKIVNGNNMYVNGILQETKIADKLSCEIFNSKDVYFEIVSLSNDVMNELDGKLPYLYRDIDNIVEKFKNGDL